MTEKNKWDSLRSMIASGLTDPEYELFCETCRHTGLNPVTKEIWAIKAGGRLQIMAGINGFLKIANSHPQFDGMETEVATDQEGRIVSATAKVYRKDRKYPSVGVALLAEFKGNTPIWSKMPSVMLLKVAKSHAIREAFSLELAGLYTPEEMPDEYAQPKLGQAKSIRPEKLLEFEEPSLPGGKVNQPEKLLDIESGEVFMYDLSNMPEDKRLVAEQYALNAGAKLVDAHTFESFKELKKLAKYQIFGGEDNE